MGLLNDIKAEVKKSGTNKGKFIYFKSGTKVRVRFLTDMDGGVKIKFHDSYQDGINVPCQEVFDKECPYCDNDDLRTRDQYAWCVWDYESKEVKILMAPVNQCSPVPGLVAMYEAYGTLTDRDYIVTKSGQMQSTTYSVVPMDKAKFRNEKAKPFSTKKFFELLDKAFPCDSSDDDEPKKKKKSKRPIDEDDDEDDDNDSETDYSDMSVKELYKMCKERDIDVKPKKTAKYYISLLEDDDSKSDDGWDDDGDEDEDDDDEWDN